MGVSSIRSKTSKAINEIAVGLACCEPKPENSTAPALLELAKALLKLRQARATGTPADHAKWMDGNRSCRGRSLRETAVLHGI